jgi:protein-L-isoaspartate(D-aspartate) O-methyltransferase
MFLATGTLRGRTRRRPRSVPNLSRPIHSSGLPASLDDMERLDAIRRFYARLIAATAGVDDSHIVDAFSTVERERHLGPGPWWVRVASGYISSETDDPAVLYQDVVVGLLRDKGINNGEPSLHAKCIAAVAPKLGETVIHIGAGTGYYTAILACLIGKEGHVHAFEIDPDLARRAADNLPHHCTVHPESAVDVPLPSADVIYVSAGVTCIPPMWPDALAPGGRLVLPLTPIDGLGCMLLVTRKEQMTYAARAISPAAFISCVGASNEDESRLLAAALEARSADFIRSLRRNNEPDETAWYIGNGWWLSTAEP